MQGVANESVQEDEMEVRRPRERKKERKERSE